MKKSIITLSLVLATFFASNVNASVNVNAVNSSVAAYTNKITATPLTQAIAKGDIEAVKKFIEYGSNVNETSNDMTPLMVAARYNQVEIINLLLAKGANAEVKNSKGYNALKYAQLSNANAAETVLVQTARA
ncbi:ankyrin repeat domain-containing protein [Flavobacterium sp. Sd200]|uniref:ankyrin repeat domain-containing protein n=1 Tax=Flavobacterium sp. Sd200 TaxID=2692211 RepID=UPI00136BDE14|nr:ankyrin repeat domain-containing protein [Flavobacterium sp. Sd200]MXN90680.1 ankyrin repeat domain-containing protein [Flavobacterium sp. Sd200]